MALLLLQLAAHPDEIAATKTGASVDGGAFLLDFSRPLARQRWCGVWNRWVGYTLALQVPVVHEGERRGRRVVTVDRIDPYFRELERLWLTRFPRPRSVQGAEAPADRVAGDFARQFPDDPAG